MNLNHKETARPLLKLSVNKDCFFTLYLRTLTFDTRGFQEGYFWGLSYGGNPRLNQVGYNKV